MLVDNLPNPSGHPVCPLSSVTKRRTHFSKYFSNTGMSISTEVSKRPVWLLTNLVRGMVFRFVWENFQICPEKFSDMSGKIFRFLWENFQICPEKFSDLSLFSVFKINLFI